MEKSKSNNGEANMSKNESVNNLLSSYVKEASLFLPLKNRKELQREMESDLLDKLEDQKGRDVTEDQMISFLKNTGSPYSTARLYSEEKPLLSAAMMPLFKLVALIVTAVLTGVNFFGYFFQQDAGVLVWAAQSITQIFTTLGGMVLIFALIDRFIPQWKLDLSDENWYPGQLSKSKHEENPSLVEHIAGWIFAIIFTYILLAMQDKLGLWYKQKGEWQFLPVLNQGFYKLIPFMVAGIIWEATGSLIYRIQQGWTLLTRLMDLLKTIFDLVITFFLLKSGWEYLFQPDVLKGTSLEDLMNLANMGKSVFPAVLILALIGLVVEIIKKSTSLLKS